MIIKDEGSTTINIMFAAGCLMLLRTNWISLKLTDITGFSLYKFNKTMITLETNNSSYV